MKAERSSMNPILDSFIAYLSRRAVAMVPLSEIDRCVKLHRQLDWGYSGDRVCITNDANLLRGSGPVISLFQTSRGHRVVVTSDLDQEHTLIRLRDEV